MLNAVRQVLDFRMTIAEWVGTAIMLGVPYLVIGVVWAALHIDALKQSDGVERIVVILGTIASWPVLLVTNVCLS
jgi:apolipoprotein N-acyltransferase